MCKVDKLKIMNHKFSKYGTKEIKRAINDGSPTNNHLLVVQSSSEMSPVAD